MSLNLASSRLPLRYTRNGKLLGDGFMVGYEPNLVPVVGFHSNGESVRVNFGVAPFTYEVSLALLARGEGGGGGGVPMITSS